MKSPKPHSRGVKLALVLAVAALSAIAIIAPASASAAKPPNAVFVADFTGVIGAYPLNGAPPTPISAPEGCDSLLAAEWSNGRLYYSAACGSGGKIFSISHPGGNPRLEVDDPNFPPGIEIFRGLTINEKTKRVYYTGYTGGESVVIRTAKLGGGTPSTFYTPGDGSQSAAVTDVELDPATGRVFWPEVVDEVGDDTSAIRSSKDGDSVADVVAPSTVDFIYRLTLGANKTLLYSWDDGDTGAVGLKKVARSGGTGTNVIEGTPGAAPYFGLESVPSIGKYYINSPDSSEVSVGPWNGSADPQATPISLFVPAVYLTVGRIEPPATDPSLAKSGEPGGKSLGVRVGCGGAAKCTLKLSGKLVGGSGKLESKTVKVKAGKKSKVTLAYTQQLIDQLAAKGGGKIKVTAKQVGGGSATTTLRVPESVTG